MRTTTRRAVLSAIGASALGISVPRYPQAQAASPSARLQSWPLNTRQATGIHDLAPAPDGGVWFTAQRSGQLGYFDPKTGNTELIALGARSSPHGVIGGVERLHGGCNAACRRRQYA